MKNRPLPRQRRPGRAPGTRRGPPPPRPPACRLHRQPHPAHDRLRPAGRAPAVPASPGLAAATGHRRPACRRPALRHRRATAPSSRSIRATARPRSSRADPDAALRRAGQRRFQSRPPIGCGSSVATGRTSRQCRRRGGDPRDSLTFSPGPPVEPVRRRRRSAVIAAAYTNSAVGTCLPKGTFLFDIDDSRTRSIAGAREWRRAERCRCASSGSARARSGSTSRPDGRRHQFRAADQRQSALSSRGCSNGLRRQGYADQGAECRRTRLGGADAQLAVEHDHGPQRGSRRPGRGPPPLPPGAPATGARAVQPPSAARQRPSIAVRASMRAASSGLWVAISAAVPVSRTTSSSIANTSVGRVRVEIAGGLVGQDQARRVGQRPADRDPLLLAAGQPGRPVVEARRRAPAARAARARAPAASRRPRPAISCGITTFSSAVKSGSRWWNW